MRQLAAGLGVAVVAGMGMCCCGRWSSFAGRAVAAVTSCLNMLGQAGEGLQREPLYSHHLCNPG